MSYRYPGLTHRVTGNTSGATALVSSGTMWLSGGNNVTLSQNGNTVEIIGATAAGQPVNFSAGTTSNNLGTVVFSNSNGVSFGLNGSTITGSHNGLTSQSNQALSAANGSFTFQTATFADSNGVSFSTGTQGIYATVKTDYLTSQSNQALSGSNGSFAFQTATFGNLNGMSFYTSNGSMVGSYTVPTQTNQTVGVYASSQTTGQSSSSTYDARSLTFRGAGIVSVGNSGGEVLISATAAANAAFSANGGSSTFQTLNVTATNGATFTNTGGSLGLASLVLSMYATSNTVQSSSGTQHHSSIIFRGAGDISVGVTNGSVIISRPSVGVAGFASAGISNLGNTSGDTGLAASSLVLAGGNNITLSGSGDIGGGATITISAANQTNQTLGLYAVSNTTRSSSGTVDARTLSFQGAGVASVGISNGSVIISAPAAAADGLNVVAIGTTGTTGTSWSSSSATIGINGSQNITVSQNNSNQIVVMGQPHLSIYEPFPLVTGSAFSSHNPASWEFNRISVMAPITITGINCPISINVSVPGATSQASTGTARYSYSKGVTLWSRVNHGANSTQWTTVSTGSFGLTAGLSYSSTSQSFVYSWVTDSTGGTSSYNTTSGAGTWSSFITGAKSLVIPFVGSLSAGEYFLAHRHSSTTGTTQSNFTLLSISQFQVQAQTVGMGVFGSSGPLAWLAVMGDGIGRASAVTSTTTMANTVISTASPGYYQYVRFAGS